MQPTGPPGWGLGTGLTTQSRRKKYCYGNSNKGKNTTVYNGPPELLKDNRMNVSSENRKVGALNT